VTPEQILLRLRRFLLVLSAVHLGGTVAELWMVEHTEDPVQFVPFVLCGLGALAAVAVLLRPRRATVWALRASAGLLVLGSLLGGYLHVEGNAALQREINPGAAGMDAVMGALGGPNPLLAPGVLAIAGVIALAATYRHPALSPARPVA